MAINNWIFLRRYKRDSNWFLVILVSQVTHTLSLPPSPLRYLEDALTHTFCSSSCPLIHSFILSLTLSSSHSFSHAYHWSSPDFLAFDHFTFWSLNIISSFLFHRSYSLFPVPCFLLSVSCFLLPAFCFLLSDFCFLVSSALGMGQSCFEGAMYTFVFMWTPALKRYYSPLPLSLSIMPSHSAFRRHYSPSLMPSIMPS